MAMKKAITKGRETPLDFMLRIMWDKHRPMDFRFEAAKAAAPYVHNRRSSVEIPLESLPAPSEKPRMSINEAAKFIAFMLTEATKGQAVPETIENITLEQL